MKRTRIRAGSCAVGVAALVALGLGSEAGAHASASSSGATCHADVIMGVLPTCARAGFSDPRPRMPYVLGRGGKIAGILFGNPLRAPAPPTGRANKILWVARTPPQSRSDLRINAQRMIGSDAVGAPVSRRVSNGPGPSIIDVPAPGCWRLTLRWSGRLDTLDLRYIPSG
jgi:hypothetical protein